MKTNLTFGYLERCTLTKQKVVGDLNTFMDEARKVASKIEKTDAVCLIPFVGKSRSLKDFTKSNIAFIDIDDEDRKVTQQILAVCSTDYFFRFFNNIIFVQQSFSGKTHIAFEMPMCNSVEEWKEYYQAYVKYFIEVFRDNFCIDASYAIDYHSAQPSQLLFISSNKVYFNNNVQVNDEYFKYVNINSSLKFGVSVKENINNNSILNITNEYNPNFEGNSNINNFVKDTDNVIETKLVIGKQHLNYNITTEQLECIKNNVIRIFDNTTNGRLLLNMTGMFEGIVDVKMKFFFKRNDKNEIVKLEQGQHRRLHLKRYIKQTILNGIAKCNYDITYEKYIISDIVYTIKWLLNNAIEVKGNTRNIDSAVVKECIADVCDNWDSFYVEYDTNRYICKPVDKITSFKELMKHWQYLKQKRYVAIDNTFMYFYETLKLQGKKYSDIAQSMNDNNVEAKTDKGWTYESVRAYVSKISNVSDYFVIIDEMIGQGEKYAEIANKLNEEGYTTKQGKEFNAKSIENYVKRKLKK